MEKIYNTTTVRSGATMTMTGFTREGSPVRVTGVTKITTNRDGAVAHAADGKSYLLGGEIVSMAELFDHKREGQPA